MAAARFTVSGSSGGSCQTAMSKGRGRGRKRSRRARSGASKVRTMVCGSLCMNQSRNLAIVANTDSPSTTALITNM